jgi:hypothetical protein
MIRDSVLCFMVVCCSSDATILLLLFLGELVGCQC